MNNRTGGYIPKSRIEKITTTLGKTIGRDKLRDGNAISDKPIKGRKVSSDNDKYLTKSEIRSIKTTDGRLIKRDFIKDGNFLKNASVKHPKVSRTQFEDEEYEYARGGSINMNKHIWEGWTVGSFIDDLEPQFDMINRGQSWQKPFATREEVKRWAMDNQPYYKKYIPEVVDYFWSKSQNKNNYYVNGGAVDSETQAKIDKIEKFINNPENQKNDPATVEKFRSILASIKPKASAPATPKVEPKATAPKRTTAPAKPRVTATAPKRTTAPAKPRVTATTPKRQIAPAKPRVTATTSKEKVEDVAERLSEVYYNTLEDLKIESGSEVYANIDVQKRLKKVLDEKIKEKSLSEAVFKYLENENAHSLNNYLSLSGLFGKEQQKDYVRLFKVYKGKSFWNPSVFGIDVNKFTFEKSKPTATPKSEPQAKTSKGVKVTGSSSVTVDGKEMDMNSKEFCDYLLKQFRDRREKSKNAPKKKTASVMAKITANVEKSVVQAIKSSVASNKKEIEKNPNFFVKKVEKLESSTKSFLQSMKDVLGDDFKQGEIASTMKSIEELTESLIAKYKTK